MSREVCGICWCPYDEETGECACVPEPTPQRKPLSEDAIFKIENDIPDDVISDRDWTIWFARAVERAAAAAERNAILQMSRNQWYKTQADFEGAIRAREST